MGRHNTLPHKMLRQSFAVLQDFGTPSAFHNDHSHPLKETTMSEPTNTLTNTQELPRELLDLAEAINSLPSEHRQALEPFLNRVVDSNRRRRRILNLVQDALSQLRLDMKYLAFDLEATRRERDEFQSKLEGNA
jgi:hypothetical protein